MALLIDGYNLLHATDIFGSGPGPDTLQSSRCALLDFLAETLDARELRDATIVFDATGAPPGLPALQHHRGITVHFAPRHADADTLIEEMIEDYHAPKTLIVVSSDHRLHRAARRRKAKPIDSEVWYAELLRTQKSRSATRNAFTKPPPPSTDEEVQFWLRKFQDDGEAGS